MSKPGRDSSGVGRGLPVSPHELDPDGLGAAWDAYCAARDDGQDEPRDVMGAAVAAYLAAAPTTPEPTDPGALLITLARRAAWQLRNIPQTSERQDVALAEDIEAAVAALAPEAEPDERDRWVEEHIDPRYQGTSAAAPAIGRAAMAAASQARNAGCAAGRADAAAEIAQAIRFQGPGHVRTLTKEQACSDLAEWVEQRYGGTTCPTTN